MGVSPATLAKAYAVFCAPDGVSKKADGETYSLGGAYFVELCEKDYAKSDGIDEQSFGWFVWDENKEKYMPIDDEYVFIQ